MELIIIKINNIQYVKNNVKEEKKIIYQNKILQYVMNVIIMICNYKVKMDVQINVIDHLRIKHAQIVIYLYVHFIKINVMTNVHGECWMKIMFV